MTVRSGPGQRVLVKVGDFKLGANMHAAAVSLSSSSINFSMVVLPQPLEPIRAICHALYLAGEITHQLFTAHRIADVFQLEDNLARA